ncbi:universal stress protein [Marinobacterium arenosum]|uniref:universal stress protein n=1 Tax=Marinobacterium arenosum TaxID=2862496 RepID=UPI001C967FF0|nr:universal stress protein [Marinobacterium arenosum]MBY4675072.1 universal stress protein [Marinobacterium arenosum]
MTKLNKVLFATNGLRDETAHLSEMLYLMGDTIAELSVLAVVPPIPDELLKYSDGFDQSIRAKLERCYQAAVGSHPTQTCRPEFEVVHGRHDFILLVQKVLREKYDLVVKQAEASSRTVGYDALDMSLLRKCPKPLWLLKGASGTPTSHPKIAVAIDPEYEEQCGYDLSIALLQHADRLAKQLTVEVDIVACWRSQLEGARENAFVRITDEDIEADSQTRKRKHRAIVEALVKTAQFTSQYSLTQLHGKAEQLIPDYTKEKAIDLLFMGTVARTGIPGFFIGNTAENILHQLSCSVVAIKPPGFVSPIKAY